MGATGLSLLMGANAYSQSSAIESQGDYQKQQMDFNASLTDMQSSDALKRGESDEMAVRKRGKQVIGSQRAALAAQGIEINEGSALAVQEDTAAITAEDALTVKNNAWREAWGYRVSANDQRSQGRMAQMAARNQARNTLLTGVTNAAATYSGSKSKPSGGAEPRDYTGGKYGSYAKKGY